MALPIITRDVIEIAESINQYTILTGKRIGCTSLVRGFDASVIPPVPVTCKIVEATDVECFMAGEGRVLHMLNSHSHPNLPRLVTSIHEDDGKGRGFILTNGYFGDLHTFVRTHKQLSEEMARPMFAQILSAVIHCHKLRISLRDIKLGKIMFANEKMTKLVFADLAGAEYFAPRVTMVHDQKGSPAYVAPEVLSGQPYDPFAADVWSIGCILYVLLTGSYPFQDARPARLFHKITHGAITFPPHVSAAAQALLLRLLARDPAMRPKAADLHLDPWLRSPFLSVQKSSVAPDPVASLLPAAAVQGPRVNLTLCADAGPTDEQIVPDLNPNPSVLQRKRKAEEGHGGRPGPRPSVGAGASGGVLAARSG